MAKNYDLLFRCLMIGDTEVGKTSVLFNFCEGVFSLNYISTVGELIIFMVA